MAIIVIVMMVFEFDPQPQVNCYDLRSSHGSNSPQRSIDEPK